jgi:hypothetical protein
VLKKGIIVGLITSVLILTLMVIKILKFYFHIAFLTALFTRVVAQPSPAAMTEISSLEGDLCSSVSGVCHPVSKFNVNYIFDKQIYNNRCDTMPQVIFWRRIMKLHKDSSLISVGENRYVVDQIHQKDWGQKNDDGKQAYRDSVRLVLKLDSEAHVLVVPGKSFFYDFEKAFQNFDRGINDFVENGVDPWYAQAILLIESPNKLQKSNAGAYGPFQLMRDVARMFGLKVNKQIDERADFDRSAYAASSLIKTLCIPYTKQMLDSLKIPYKENELWFRLLVMHSYHAGAGNVRKALFSFMPTKPGMDIVYTLWHTKTTHFKSASQNYSQLVLAAMLEMDRRMNLVSYVDSNPILPK